MAGHGWVPTGVVPSRTTRAGTVFPELLMVIVGEVISVKS